MRRPVLRVLPLAAVALLSAPPRAGEPAPPASPPRVVSAALPATHLVIEKDVLDLGEISRGGKAEASFVLRNTGTTPIKILSAKPG